MSRRWTAVVAGAVVALTCVLFAPSLDGEFLQLDDPAYVTHNDAVRAGLTSDGLRHVVTHDTGSMWLPLSMVSHMVDVELWGLRPAGHHLTNVVLHALNAGLLFLLLSALTGAPGRSLAVALLFAWHPLRVESVAWIAERKDVLSGLFAIMTIDAYRRWVRTPTVGRYALVAVLLACGLLAKSMLVTLPVLLLLLDEWPLRRADVPWGRRIGEKLPLFAIAGAAAIVTAAVVGQTGGMVSLTILSVPDRLANAVVSVSRYLLLTAWPTNLAVYYPMPPAWPAAVVAAAGVVVAALCATILLAWRRAPAIAIGLAWFLVALAPVSGVVQAGMQAMADRFTYLPSIGLGIAVVWTGAELTMRRRFVRVVAAAAIAIALVGATTRQQRHWRTDQTLFDHTLAVTEDNWFIHSTYADALMVRGDADEAARHYEAALALEPRLAKAQHNLGALRFAAGDVDAAVVHLAEALRLEPTRDDSAASLAAAVRAQGHSDQAAETAVEVLRRGVERARRDRKRGHGEAYYGLVTKHMMTAFGEAVGRCRTAATAAPPFDLFVTVGEGGVVRDASTSPPSELAACVAGEVGAGRLPAPPFAPFHVRLAMRLQG